MDASLHMTRVACPRQAGSKLLPQVEEVEYLQVLFVRQRRKEQVYAPVLCHGEEGAECESEAVELPVDHLWPWTLNSNQNNDGSHTSGGKEVPLKGV